MKKRGRPIELDRETTEGRVGRIIYKLRESGDFGRTIRYIARLSCCSLAAVKRTLLWRGYLEAKRGPEGQVWKVVSKLRAAGDFLKTDIEISRMTGLPRQKVKETKNWRLYESVQKIPESQRSLFRVTKLRRQRGSDTTEGRIIQIVRDAMRRSDYSISVGQITARIGCSSASVANSLAWRDYILTREREKAAEKARRKDPGIM